jgi:predicted nucleic acid-binding protein
MSADSFIDTNVFLYNIDDSDQRKHEIATNLILTALDDGKSCISYQVVQECINAGLRKAHIPLDHQTAERYLGTVLIPLWKINPSKGLYQFGIDLQARYQFSFYDSLIVAAALEAGCKILFSEDLQHGQRIEQLTIQNPFIDRPN